MLVTELLTFVLLANSCETASHVSVSEAHVVKMFAQVKPTATLVPFVNEVVGLLVFII
jgi:hypothetical protein